MINFKALDVVTLEGSENSEAFHTKQIMIQVIIPTTHCFDGPLFRQPISPTTHYSVKNGQK
jgi:hypothetical protein